MSTKSISFFTLLITAWTTSVAYAQDPTDLYLFQLHAGDDHSYTIYQAKYLSGFNPGGYTNQPWFTPEGNLLVSVRKAGEKQNDIYQLGLKTNTIKRITQTSANEYSPRWHPDGQRLTIVRQVEGDSIDQQIFQSALKGGGYKSLTPGIKNIGYYAWIGNDQLAIFTLNGEDNHLLSLSLKDNRTRRVTSSVGRSIWSEGAGSVTYVHKFTDTYWYLKRYNLASGTIDIIAETPGLTEDFALSPDGTYFMAMGSKLYCFNSSQHTNWQEVGDLSIHGITKITRLAISPDGNQLALVSTK